MVDDVGMFVVGFALDVKSMAMVFVDHGVRSFTRRERRLTACWGLRAFGVRLFGILVLFPGLPICSDYLYLQKGYRKSSFVLWHFIC